MIKGSVGRRQTEDPSLSTSPTIYHNVHSLLILLLLLMDSRHPAAGRTEELHTITRVPPTHCIARPGCGLVIQNVFGQSEASQRKQKTGSLTRFLVTNML